MLKYLTLFLVLFLSSTVYGQDIILKSKTYKEIEADNLEIKVKFSESGADEEIATKALKKGAAETIAIIGTKTSIYNFKITQNEYTVNKVGNYLSLNHKLIETEDYCIANLSLKLVTPSKNVKKDVLLKQVCKVLNNLIEPIIRYTTFDNIKIGYTINDLDTAYESLLHDAIAKAKLDAVTIAKSLGKEKVVVKKITKISSDVVPESPYSSVTLSVELEITFEVQD